jgi:ATP-dependent protease HslVU (ClpYQ) peptidase subunit
MSTITVVRKAGFVAIAADTLTKYGYVKESADYVVNHSKIISFGDIYMASAGPTAAKFALQDLFRSLKKIPDLSNVDSIFAAWVDIHKTLKEKYYLRAEEDDKDSFESSRVDVLIMGKTGIFGVGTERTVQEFSKFYAVGSGAEVALGAMYVAYANPDRSAEDIARLGVEAASQFDDSTGLPILSYTLPLASG